MSDAYLANSARNPAFGSGDGDLSEGTEYGIAFAVLLFFGALGWWLMQPEGAEPTLAAVKGEPTDYRFEREAVVATPRPRRERVAEPVAAAAAVQPAVQAEPEPVVEEIVEAVPLAPVEEAVVAPEIFEEVAQPVVEEVPEEVPEEVVEEVIVEEAVVEEPVVQEPQESEAELFQRAASNVRFVTASAELTQPSKTILDDIFALVESRPDAKLRIVGHTDSQGEADKNARLSYARAEACQNYLLEKGLTVERVSAAGFGELQPIASNLTEEGRRENRRVEFELVPLEE